MPGLDVTELCDMLVTEEEVHGWKPLEELLQNGQLEKVRSSRTTPNACKGSLYTLLAL